VRISPLNADEYQTPDMLLSPQEAESDGFPHAGSRDLLYKEFGGLTVKGVTDPLPEFTGRKLARRLDDGTLAMNLSVR